MNTHLHIVCFTIPYPINYGGVFDPYYKIVALSEAGVRIHLHCFTTGRKENHLESICEQVSYYPRNTGIKGWSPSIPYIVSSRTSRELVDQLNNDSRPVLAEGVHSTAFLFDENFKRKNVALRLHNVEHIYYRKLYEKTSNPIKALYYRVEAALLEKYERRLAASVDKVFAVSSVDQGHYSSGPHAPKTELLPVFVSFPFTSQPGRGCYCLYHGNLSVEENAAAVEWLVRSVFANTDVPLIVAGNNPPAHLKRAIRQKKNVSLVADPTDTVLHDLLAKAQCHVLPSENSTGVKLKLIHALYSGRHCIVNTAAVRGSGLESLCHVADSAGDFKSLVLSCYRMPFTSEEAENRNRVLSQVFDKKSQVSSLIQWLS